METYFVIENCDGDTHVTMKTKEELLEDVREGNLGCEGEPRYITEQDLKEGRDTNYWGGQPLIIKGSVVIPKPIKVVTDYSVD